MQRTIRYGLLGGGGVGIVPGSENHLLDMLLSSGVLAWPINREA